MNKQQLSAKLDEFVGSQDDEKIDEYYCSRRKMAQDVVRDFKAFAGLRELDAK